jgi:hypothetical protein
MYRHSVRRSLAAVTAALALCATAACGGDDDSPAGPPDADVADTAQGADNGPQPASTSNLVWNECPIDLETVNAITGLDLNNDEHPCDFRDGIRVVSITVQGADLDPRASYEAEGLAAADIDRGDYGFIATKDIEAQAYVVVGDLSLSIGLLSFDLDQDGYRALALDLIDACLD